MNVEFVPPSCKAENAAFSGHVVMKMPHAAERFRILKRMGVKVGESGEASAMKDNLDVLSELCLVAEEFMVESKLKDLDGNVVSKEQIFYNDGNQKWVTLISEISGFVSGLGLGKN